MAINTTSTSLGTNTVKQTYLQKVIDLTFAPKLMFVNDIVANGKVAENGRDARPGDPVTWTRYDRIAPSTATLSETASGTPETMTAAQVTVNLLEKGNHVATTEKLDRLSFEDIETLARDLIAENAARSTDQYAMEVAETQTGAAYVTYGQDGQRANKSTITAADTLDTSTVLRLHDKLASANVPPVVLNGSEGYILHLHSQVIHDLKNETAGTTFREVSLYAAPEERLTGEVGMYEGFRIIQNNSVKVDYKAGEEKQAATTVDGAHTAGATVVALTDATGIVAGNVVVITDGSGDEYAYTVESVATNDVTIGKAVRKNGFFIPRPDGSGLVTALSGGEAAEESSAVYSCYAMGRDAFAYAKAVTPEIRISDDNADAFGRVKRYAWYALHGIGEYAPESLHKLYISSSLNPNG